MNIDSLSLALSQVSYLVANLNKKTYKQNTSEILSIVEKHGVEAERHLFRCLFSSIDFGGDGKSSGKDYHQTQLLVQELNSLISRQNFVTAICNAVENPFSNQKSLFPSSTLIQNISKVVHLSKAQEIALAVALQQSSSDSIKKCASSFLENKLPDFVQYQLEHGKKNSEDAQSSVTTEVFHFVLTHIFQSNSLLSAELQSSLLSSVRKEYPLDKCPAYLLPVLYGEKEDIHMERILSDSASMASLMVPTLADILRELGYASCASVEECRRTLQQYKYRTVTSMQAAYVLSMMSQSTSESLDNIVSLQSLSGSSGWSDNKEKVQDAATSWNVDVFIQAVKETNSSITSREVMVDLDHHGFIVKDAAGLRLLVRALYLLSGAQKPENFPTDLLFRHWKNAKAQLSWIEQSLQHPNIFSFADHVTRLTNVDVLKQPLDEDNRELLTWKNLDLVECLISLSEREGMREDVRNLFQWPYKHCPDLLALSLIQSGNAWQTLRRELILSLMPVFLGSHPNAAMVLNFIWNGPVQPASQNIAKQLVLGSMAEWYMKSDQSDQHKLSRILDVAQDLKALSLLLNGTPFSFVIDLAALASRREYLKLDKWLNDKIREHREEFIKACLNFLKRRCLGGTDENSSVTVPPETMSTMLTCLQNYIGGVEPDLSEAILQMVQSCNFLNKSRPLPPPGVMGGAKPRLTSTSTPVQPSIQAVPLAPNNTNKVDNILTKPMDPNALSGFDGNKLPVQPQLSSLSRFGQSADFSNSNLSSINSRLSSAILPSPQATAASISSPVGSGILPPSSVLSDTSAIGSSLGGGNTTGNIAPIGVPPVSGVRHNSSNLHLGSSTANGAFSSSIAGGLHPLLNNNNDMNTSLGLSSMPTSSSATGFGTSQISSHFSELTGLQNPIFQNIRPDTGLSTGSNDGFSSGGNKQFDPFANSQKNDLFRPKVPDFLSQQSKQNINSPVGGNLTGTANLGNTFGASIGTGLDMFGQKKQGMPSNLGPAAQQAFQQAKTTIKPSPESSTAWPEMNQQFSKEIEDEANGYFQRIYNQPPNPTLSVDDILDLLQNFKDSSVVKEREVFGCMMRNLFEEYRFFPQYPDKELHITACLFGGIIEKNLVTYLPLGIALRYVLEALRKPSNSKMYYFGIAALDRFKGKLKDYPQYCIHIATIQHFKEFPSHLVEYVECGRLSKEPTGKLQGSVTTPGSLAFAQQQQKLQQQQSGGQQPTSNSTPVNVTTAATTSASKLPLSMKDVQQPSIAKATNIDILLGAQVPEEKIPEPPENVQDKIAFIFNNLSVANMSTKADEMRECTKEEYTPWLSQYLVMKRVSIEPNFHLLYSNFLDTLKIGTLSTLVKEEVFRNIQVLLRSDKAVANFSDRSLLKNLGHFLGIISLSKNIPILYEDIDLKSLLYEAYAKGAQELLYVVPFIAKVLESVGKSKVFKLPNPWTQAIMSALVELHMEPDLKLNLKFEIEVLCKNLFIDINDIKPSTYLRDPEIKFKIENQLSTSKKDSLPASVNSKPNTPSEQLQTEMQNSSARSSASLNPSSLSAGFPQTTITNQQTQPSPPQPTITLQQMQPRFSFHDINIYSISTLQSHLTVKMEIPLMQAQPHLKMCVRTAVERAVQEVIQPAVERAIKIALTTCEQIVRKDFALDPEEFRMQTAAHHMVRNLTAGMALITCREQLLNGIMNNLKQSFMQALTRNPQALAPQQKELLQTQIDQAASVIAQDNVELACCFIQKTAVERAILDMDKRMANEYELRKQARQEGRRYCDPRVLTYQAERMPEQIRLKVGGVTPQQTAVYEEFASSIPGFVPTKDPGFLAKPMQDRSFPVRFDSATPDSKSTNDYVMPSLKAWPVDDITQVYDRCIQEVEQHLTNLLNISPTSSFAHLQGLHEALLLARNSREIVTALALLQKAVEGLLDSPTLTNNEPEVLARYRDCHIVILKALQDQRSYGPLWTNKQVTQCLINHRDEYKYNHEAVELLIRSHLVNMQQYDQHLAQAMENGLNYVAVVFAMQLCRLFLIEEKQNSPISDSDLQNTLDVLNKINTMSRGAAPEGLSQLVDMIRSNYDGSMTDKTPGGPTHMMHSGINQAREYDDPPGLHEKTEYLLREWVNIYHSPTSGRDSTRGFSAFVQQMHQQGILRTDDLITRFFRLCTEMCVDLTYRLLQQDSNVTPSLLNPTLVRAKCFHTLDAFVRLITLLVKHSGDAVNSVTKINLLNKVLGIVVGVLLQDHETRSAEFHQMPYHRIFIMLFYELNAPEHVLESINFQTLTAFTNTYHILRPSKAPGFAFAWLEVISYRAFISRMLLHTPQQKGWPMYAQLLIDLFKFLAPFLRNVELTKSIQILYRGSLRLLLVLLHDFPEFLCDYHYGFCDVIPANCIQLRNLILSAFPRNMRLPDPFTPNLKVDMLQEINVAPRILTNFTAIMPTTFKKDLESYLNSRSPVTFLSDLRSNLQMSSEPGLKYNVPLINSLVLHVGTTAITYIHSKGSTPSMATITHSSHMDIFQNLAVDLDTEGRYLFLNAIANQLRYPNSHTHYFSCTLLYLFAEANQESIQEQITRVLLERLIVNRPHPWGLLITFIELIKNPNFKFWSHEFVHCAPEISKLFESVARSCMGKQFSQQSGSEAASSTTSTAVTAVTSTT